MRISTLFLCIAFIALLSTGVALAVALTLVLL
jgi:hypothetical protein